MHCLHSKLQTIIYIDLSLSTLINHIACLSLFLCCLHTSSASSLPFSSSLSVSLHSKLLKIQVTLLNNLPRKSFGSSHYFVLYGLWNHIPHPHFHLPVSPCIPPPFFPLCISNSASTFTEMSRNCLCETFIHCASILWKQIYFSNSIRRRNTYTHLDLHH